MFKKSTPKGATRVNPLEDGKKKRSKIRKLLFSTLGILSFGYLHFNEPAKEVVSPQIIDSPPNTIVTEEVNRDLHNVNLDEKTIQVNNSITMNSIDSKYILESRKSWKNRKMPSEILNEEEMQFLISKVDEIKEKSENLRTGLENNMVFYINLENEMKNLRMLQVKVNLLRDNLNPYLSPSRNVSFLERVRFQEKSFSVDNNGERKIDFTQINPQLSKYIMQYSQEYDINPRLVAAICTNENNFGDQSISRSGARGMCQTMPDEVRKEFSDYDTMDEEEKNWAHFIYTFKHLKTLKDKFELKIGFDDDVFNNRLDFFISGVLYHSGESVIFKQNNGNIVSGSDAEKYVQLLSDSFNFWFYLGRGFIV